MRRVEHTRGSDWRMGVGAARQTDRQRGLVGATSWSRRGGREWHSVVQGIGGRSRALGAAMRLGERIPLQVGQGREGGGWWVGGPAAACVVHATAAGLGRQVDPAGERNFWFSLFLFQRTQKWK
jgi:hypothetical protein